MLISHLTSLPLLLLLLAQTALTSPTPPPPTSFLRLRPRLVESTPWQLHDLRIFTAQPGTPGISYISFTFADSNAGLNLTTACTRYVPQGSPGGGGAVADGSVFSACANATVGWTFDGARIAVQRVYRDASVGSPPWDRVTAFGEVVVANLTTATTTTTSKSTCGTLVMSKVLKVPVTRLVSKRK